MPPKKDDPIRHCSHCGAQLERKSINGRMEDRGVFLRRKYCGRACMAQAMIQDEVKLDSYRARAEKFRKDKCEECDTTERLQVHHLDSNPANNDLSNLMTLCASCHLKWHWRNGKTTPKRLAPCTVCGEPSESFDLCQKHYVRFKKYGDPRLTKKNIGGKFVLVENP